MVTVQSHRYSKVVCTATPEKAALEHASSAADEIGLSPMIKHGAPGLFEEGPDQGAPSSSIPAVHGPTAPAAAAAPPTADPVQRPNTNPGPGGAVVVADGSRKQVASRPATAAAGGGGPHSGHIQPLLFHRLDLVVRPLVGNKCALPRSHSGDLQPDHMSQLKDGGV